MYIKRSGQGTGRGGRQVGPLSWVGENFPPKQDRIQGNKCAVESQFPAQKALRLVLWLKYERPSWFILSLFTLTAPLK